jgi:hypothetical protein
MSDLVFPSTLRPIVSKGYGQKRGGNIWSSQVQGGRSRQGRDTYYDAVPINVALVASKLGRLAFWTFYHKISGGADSFIMSHDTGAGIEPHNVQIDKGSVNETTQNGVYWNITFTAVAERTSVQDDSAFNDSILELFGEYGDGLPAFIDYYTLYCTSPMFINDLPEPS